MEPSLDPLVEVMGGRDAKGGESEAILSMAALVCASFKLDSLGTLTSGPVGVLCGEGGRGRPDEIVGPRSRGVVCGGTEAIECDMGWRREMSTIVLPWEFTDLGSGKSWVGPSCAFEAS